MNKTRLLTVLCLLTFTVGALAVGRQQGQVSQSSQDEPPEIPDHIAYRHLFNHVVAFRKEADKAEREGKDAEPYKGFFRRKAELSEDQAAVLDEIARECSKEVKGLDTKAKSIVDGYLAQYPGGQVPHGEKPAPRPTGLREMAQERDELVLRCRDRLRAALGEGEFARFNDFVKRRIAPNVHLAKPGQAPPPAQTAGAEQQSPR